MTSVLVAAVLCLLLPSPGGTIPSASDTRNCAERPAHFKCRVFGVGFGCARLAEVGVVTNHRRILTSEGRAESAAEARETGTGLPEETASDSVHRKAHAGPGGAFISG